MAFTVLKLVYNILKKPKQLKGGVILSSTFCPLMLTGIQVKYFT